MSPAPPQRPIRLGRHAVCAWLDRLDQRAELPRGDNVRRSGRFPYRPDALSLTVRQADGTNAPYAVVCRNLSREGAGVLAGQFIYPRSRCTLELVSPHGRRQAVAARVARCRYLLGSGSLHEVGLVFEQPVDVSLFAPHARLVRVLLIDAAERNHELVAGLLANLHADLHCTTNPVDAVAAMATQKFDVLLLDLEGVAFDALALTRQLRDTGYVEPIVGMAVHTGRELRSRCAAAGCTGYIPKPVTRDDLEALVQSLSGPPLVSTLAQDAALAPLIDRYVESLREQASEMSLASETGEIDALQALVRKLRAEAGSYGFEAITRDAAYVDALLVAEEPLPRIRRALGRLLHLCLKARPATSPPDAAPAYMNP